VNGTQARILELKVENERLRKQLESLQSQLANLRQAVWEIAVELKKITE
jgi:hypothetical protein